MDTIQKIKDFFKSYEDRFNRALKGDDDIDETVAAFAECFVSASPSGVVCGFNNDEFRNQIPMGNQFYRDIGTVFMSVDHIEVTKLNSLHFMVKVFWKSGYSVNGERKDIDFDVIYLLQQRNELFKIFAFITEDEQKVLREHGVLAT